MKKEVTSEELRRLFIYNPDTGIFTRLVDHWCGKAGAIAGGINTIGYVTIGVHGKRHYAHRLAILYMTGEWPPHDVDHINGIRDDNRYSNLRLATRKQNRQNVGARSTNKSGVKGVFYVRKCPGKPWRADIYIDGKNRFLGHFSTKEEAGAAYKTAAVKHQGEFAKSG